MLASISRFFSQKFAASQAPSAESEQRRTRLAAAALLVEVTRSDDQISAAERAELLATISRKFSLDPEEATRLVELAEEEVREATDMYQFTAQINRLFSREQKHVLMEELWRVAYADEILHHREEYLIRRIADLIHVPHSAFIATKLRAQTE